MVELTDFTKIYHLTRKQRQRSGGKKQIKTAVKNLSFTASKGQIFGLLGPNGAGKTTTLRSIGTLLKPTEGSITVAGYDTATQPEEIRKRIGFLTNELKLESHFTPDYTMHFFGKLHQLSDDVIAMRTKLLFDAFGIGDYKHQRIKELSTGMTQKLAIAVSLIHDPEVIIFDEPTNGLDIITAKAVTEYLSELKAQGKLIIISTHIMSVAESLCDRIAILIDGNKVADGTLNELLFQNDSLNLEEAFFKLYEKHQEEVR